MFLCEALSALKRANAWAEPKKKPGTEKVLVGMRLIAVYPPGLIAAYPWWVRGYCHLLGLPQGLYPWDILGLNTSAIPICFDGSFVKVTTNLNEVAADPAKIYL